MIIKENSDEYKMCMKRDLFRDRKKWISIEFRESMSRYTHNEKQTIEEVDSHIFTAIWNSLQANSF